MNNLLNNCKISRVVVHVADGQAATAGDILDMEGFAGVLFIAKVGGAATNGSVITLAAQQNSVNSSSGMATLTGTATHTDDDDADDDLLILDVVNPEKRYIRPVFTTATQDATKSGVIAIQYRAKDAPVTQPATVLDSETISNPIEA